MAYVNSVFHNFDGVIQNEVGELYKRNIAPSTEYSSCNSIYTYNRIKQYIALDFYIPSTIHNYNFYLFLNDKNYENINFPDDVYYGFYVSTNNEIKIYHDNTEVLTLIHDGSNTTYFRIRYEISDVFEGFVYYINNTEVYRNSISLNINLPLYVWFFTLDTYDYPVKVSQDIEGYPDVKLESINPDNHMEINLINTFEFVFNVDLDITQNIDDKINIYINDSVLDTNNYQITIVNNKILITLLNNVLNYNNNLKFEFINGIASDFYTYLQDNINIEYQIRKKEEEILKHLNENLNNIYYKYINFFKFFDIDSFIKNKEELKLIFHPFDIEQQKLLKDKIIIVNNDKYIEDNLINQLLNDYVKYMDFLRNHSNFSENEYNNTLLLLLKNSFNIHAFKGRRKQIEFVYDLFNRSIGYYITKVNKNPYETLKYRIESCSPKEYFERYIKPQNHPVGFQYQYFHIDKCNIWSYIQKELDFTIQLYAFSKTSNIRYIDLNYSRDKDYNYKKKVYDIKTYANVCIDNLMLMKYLPFKERNYQVKTYYINDDFLEMLLNEENKEILYIKHYADKPGKLKWLFNSYGTSLYSELIIKKFNVNLYKKEVYNLNNKTIHEYNLTNNYPFVTLYLHLNNTDEFKQTFFLTILKNVKNPLNLNLYKNIVYTYISMLNKFKYKDSQNRYFVNVCINDSIRNYKFPFNINYYHVQLI